MTTKNLNENSNIAPVRNYPYEETVSFLNPLDCVDRDYQKFLVKRAFDMAGIADALITEETSHIKINFHSFRDMAHFEIAYEVPIAYLSRVEETDMCPVCMDFVSVTQPNEKGQAHVTDAQAVIIAFETAAEKSLTSESMVFEKEGDVVIVNTANPIDYFRFWKAVPETLKKTLYLADSLSPA